MFGTRLANQPGMMRSLPVFLPVLAAIGLGFLLGASDGEEQVARGFREVEVIREEVVLVESAPLQDDTKKADPAEAFLEPWRKAEARTQGAYPWRERLPTLSDWQLKELEGYRKKNRERFLRRAFDVAATLRGDKEVRIRAVQALEQVKRDRRDFVRSVLNQKQWQRWLKFQESGGMDREALLARVQELSQRDSKE